MIAKEQVAAVIKAVEEGGDDDDEITEDEAIAILQDTKIFLQQYLPKADVSRCSKNQP